MKIVMIIMMVLFVLPASSVTQADIKFSGYGSIIAGQTLDKVDDPLNPGQERDQIFTADFYDVGQYSNEFSFRAESIFALQATMDLGTGLKATAQLVAKGVDDFEPEFDWYYLTYQATGNLTLMAGRRNIPMYYFSEFSEVGYAYPWMRPPSNLYWWQVTQFDSVQAAYDFSIGDLASSLTFFYGNEYSYGNVEMEFYDMLYGGTAASVDEFWTDILGINWNISGDNFDLRFVYFQNDRDRNTTQQDGSIDPYDPFSQTFFGVGGYVELSDFTLLFDANYVDYDDSVGTIYPTYFVSVVYNWNKYHPYIVYSKADHEQDEEGFVTKDLEEHYVFGIGLRYDLRSKVALKVQYDRFEEQGHQPSGWAYHGDSDTITAGIDFIF